MFVTVLKEAWNTAQHTEDKRQKTQGLSLAKECYSMKLGLLTNATVVDNAIRFVSPQKSNENLKSSYNSNERFCSIQECDDHQPRNVLLLFWNFVELIKRKGRISLKISPSYSLIGDAIC